jgi:hypothetical protein
MKSAIGTFASSVSPACRCTFDPVAVDMSVLAVINPACPEHGLDAVKAYHLLKTGEPVDDDAHAMELLLRDTPEEYD